MRAMLGTCLLVALAGIVLAYIADTPYDLFVGCSAAIASLCLAVMAGCYDLLMKLEETP